MGFTRSLFSALRFCAACAGAGQVDSGLPETDRSPASSATGLIVCPPDIPFEKRVKM